jgi:hypothetical protein
MRMMVYFCSWFPGKIIEQAAIFRNVENISVFTVRPDYCQQCLCAAYGKFPGKQQLNW